jgi:starch synthase (maltosyl-transferring)
VLKKLYKELKHKKGKKNYKIPAVWNGIFKEKKEIEVDPYQFLSDKIEKILEIKEETSPKEFQNLIFYSMLLRTTTAYPHSSKFEVVDKNGYKNTGTILKTIAILDYLKNLGVNVLYLLPISKYSDEYKKGEIGSPYAVKNFLKIDPNLRDPLSDLNVEEQFKALVEACHIMGIKVILDFIPRTAARDNELILENPQWFYWIKSEFKENYKPPHIEDLGFVQPDPSNIDKIYSSKETIQHLKKFSVSPDLIDKTKWEKFVSLNKNNPKFMDEIEKEFKVLTPPGFSDWVNDPQPLWSDITFLRLYLSHPKEALKYVSEDQPPYILFDVIKSGKFPSERKNEKLWEFISNIIPTYQRKYGIDGARIDMGHALPKDLESSIIKNARDIDPQFIFIAEELDMNNDKKAKLGGYDFILGNSWWSEPRIDEGEMEKFVKILPKLQAFTFATSETPDTPRSVTRKYGKRFSKFSAVLNAFLPKASEVINSGFEFYEKQPMNLGLDNDENGRFVLDKEDEFYGKLAFFDNYCLHWKNDFEIYELLKYVNKIKVEFSDTIKVENLRYFDTKNKNILSLHYQNNKKGLLILINKNFNSSELTEINYEVLQKLNDYKKEERIIKGKFLLKEGEITILTYNISENKTVQFKVEKENLKPHKKYFSDAGWDLKSKINLTLRPRESFAVPTGVYCSIPQGYVGLIKPRSGLAVKYSIDTLAGVIDSEYRGEVKVVLINHGDKDFEISKGDRIAQLVVAKILLDSTIVDELDKTDRSSNGFGSTGRR